MVQHNTIDHTGVPGVSSGSVATDAIWDAAGDLAVGSGANTAARLAIGGTNGMALQRVSGAVAWALPPGYEFDYTERTTDQAISATNEGTAHTLITTGSVAYDGSTVVYVEFFCTRVSTAANSAIVILLYEDSTLLGRFGLVITGNDDTADVPVFLRRRLTPSAASHTYTVKAYRTNADGTMYFASGGTGDELPGYVRVAKA